MSAEGMPPRGNSLLARLLMLFARSAVCFPRATLALAIVAAGASLYLSGTRLTYHTSRAALVDEREDYHRRWMSYVAEFGDKEDVVVVVQGDKRDTLIPVLDEVVSELARQPKYFQTVLHEIDLKKIREKGLFYLSTAELQTIEGFLNDVEPIVRGGWAWLSPGTMATGMAAQLQQVRPEQLQQAMAAAQVKLAQMAESLLMALSKPGAYKSPWPEMSGSAAPLAGLTSHRLINENGRLGFVLLKLGNDTLKSFIPNEESLQALQELVDRVKSRHPEVKVGLTGLPVMEYDEMRCSQSSMSLTTILSFVGVFVVLVAGFGVFRHSLLAMATLVLGLICALGYTTLAVGHLNILSSAFGAVLTGLGINYSIYYVARYLQLRRGHLSINEAIVGTAGSVGPGIVVSALASAIGFFMAGFAEFTGVAELGLVAGGGILLCLAAAMAVLPAILRLADARRIHLTVPEPLDFHRWLKPIVARPWLVLVVSLLGSAVVATGMGRVRYDYNLLRLQPANLESVELEQKVLSETKDSAYYALSLVKTPQEAAARKLQFLQLSTVERVDEIASRFPADTAQKQPIIERLRQRLAGLPERPPQIPVASPAELGQMLSSVQPLLAANLQMATFQRQFQEVQSVLGQLPPAEYYARLSEYQQRVAADLLGRLHLLRSVANPEPPQPRDLPDGLTSRFLGKQGSHLLRVYVKGDMWDIENMQRFVTQVRSVDPEITGNPLQIYEASRQMRRSYEHAALYALLAIIPVVLLNFGSPLATLLSLTPLVMGMLQMFGLMGMLDIPLNAANMIGLSLMLGMGMENGVLITHDYLGQRGPYRMGPSTAVAVVLNTLTTMVGFAVLITADHRGLQSLGRVLTLGMACVLFSSLVILPALLAWLTRSRRVVETADDEQPAVVRHSQLDIQTPAAERYDPAPPAPQPQPLRPRLATLPPQAAGPPLRRIVPQPRTGTERRAA